MKTRTDEGRTVHASRDGASPAVAELLAENERLQRELGALAARHEQSHEEYVLVEQQNTTLANLYVASFRLHGTTKREEVLAAIDEIIINLVGSEEYAVFTLAPGASTLSLATSFGVDRARWGAVRVGQGVIGQVAASGERRFSPHGARTSRASADDVDPLVCVPLVLDGAVLGVIAIFRLLPQKSGLEAGDHELLELLATQAAAALTFADLYATRRRGLSA